MKSLCLNLLSVLLCFLLAPQLPLEAKNGHGKGGHHNHRNKNRKKHHHHHHRGGYGWGDGGGYDYNDVPVYSSPFYTYPNYTPTTRWSPTPDTDDEAAVNPGSYNHFSVTRSGATNQTLADNPQPVRGKGIFLGEN